MKDEKTTTNNASIIRVHKTKNYTIISNEALFEKPPLSLNAKGLLCFMLALPEDWSYSIDGLVSICKEGRHTVKTTLKELKERGYLEIEKITPNKSKSGRFEYIYHIFETKQQFKKQEVEIQPLEIQALEKQEVENQPNNKELITKELNNQNTNKQLSLVKTETSVLTCEDLFNLYKSICINFSQPRELDEKRKKQATKRLEKRPQKEFWLKVFQNAEKSKFMRSSSFFTFDWVIKNDNNPLKVYEGNYNRVEISESQVQSESKYSKCYG